MTIKLASLRVFVALLAAIILSVFVVAAVLWNNYQAWLDAPLLIPNEGLSLEVQQGQTLSHVSYRLAQQKVLTHPRWLAWTARHQQLERIHSGEYFIKKGSTPKMLLGQLNRGEVVLHQVTFLEGWTFNQILNLLDSKTEIQHKLTGKSTEEQLRVLDIGVSHPEGWFFPDTYSYSKGMSDVEILQIAYKAMQKNLMEAWESRSSNLPFKTPYEALILASIVEKETGATSERDKIAGVFIRRLQQGMRLQTDPTVVYGMGDKYRGNITKNDLMTPTPYNTYVIDRLPPTPISMPGRSSLQAVMHPDDSKNLYFVAKGDGTSEFSANLTDHQRAVVRYQLKRSADYRSAPPPKTNKAKP